jgi:hypothetical protein
MVWRCAPAVVQQLHCAEFLQHNAAPVDRRTRRLKAALAFPAVLLTQYTQFAFPVAAQSVRANSRARS